MKLVKFQTKQSNKNYKNHYNFRYTVSAETGYVAEVTYKGTPVYPAAPAKVKRANKKAKKNFNNYDY